MVGRSRKVDISDRSSRTLSVVAPESAESVFFAPGFVDFPAAGGFLVPPVFSDAGSLSPDAASGGLIFGASVMGLEFGLADGSSSSSTGVNFSAVGVSA